MLREVIGHDRVLVRFLWQLAWKCRRLKIMLLGDLKWDRSRSRTRFLFHSERGLFLQLIICGGGKYSHKWQVHCKHLLGSGIMPVGSRLEWGNRRKMIEIQAGQSQLPATNKVRVSI